MATRSRLGELPRAVVDPLIERALAEDLSGGDLTTQSCVDGETQAEATAVARHQLVVCGGELFARVFALVDPATEVELLLPDGVLAKPNDGLWQVKGAARSLLLAERVALNFVQRMCGVATLAREYVTKLAPYSRTRITDTRKTTPGLRILERYAVRVGGAHNHRDNLGSAVMIKDNHIAVAGTITAAVRRAQALAPHSARVEVEVGSFAELEEALAAKADIVMLDNMSDEMVTEALRRVAARKDTGAVPIVEVSGGITLERITVLSGAGVDVISVGALTHSAPAADISLEFAFQWQDEATVAG